MKRALCITRDVNQRENMFFIDTAKETKIMRVIQNAAGKVANTKREGRKA